MSILLTGVALLVFLIANGLRQRRGVRVGLLLMSAEWLLNLIVVVANHGMPTPPAVLDGDTWWPNLWLMPHLLEHVPLDGGSRLPWLADTIELRLAHARMPFSAGDLLLYVGGAVFLHAAMRRRDDGDRRRDRRSSIGHLGVNRP